MATRWSSALFVCMAVGLGACGSEAAPSRGLHQGGHAGSEAPRELGAVLSPDSSFSFNLTERRGSSMLVGVHAATGEKVSSTPVPGDLQVRTASADGSAVALVGGEAGATAYEFVDRSKTRIVVARPERGSIRSFELPGNFEPEAFSTDTRKLFLIEYLTDDGLRYRVRMMRLGSGRVLPVGRLTKYAPDSMRGTGRVQVYSPDLDFLYTLYTRQPPNYAHQDHAEIHNDGMVHAFVHVLNLRRGWAHCIDLPMPFGMDTEPASELTVSRDGRRLYARDGRRIAVVDTRALRTTRLIEDPR